ncbi:MAG: RNA polymerase sigma factor [Clostridia bacterium]
MDKEQLERIVEEVKNGSLDQFELIIEALQQPIFTYCYHMLGQWQEAEDAVQEVLIKAYENIDKYTQSLSFSAWVYKIAYHHCLNALHRKRLYRFVPFLKWGMHDQSQDNTASSVDEEYISDPLHKALSTLSTDDRNLILLRVLEEKGYEELSQMLNKKPAALRKQYERAIKRCKLHYHKQKGGKIDESIRAIH